MGRVRFGVALALAASLLGVCGCGEAREWTLAEVLAVERVAPDRVAEDIAPGDRPYAIAEDGGPLIIAGNGGPLIIDTRCEEAFREAHLPGSTRLPYDGLVAYLRDLAVGNSDRPVVTVCYHGVQSLYAASLARDAGFADARSLSGGFLAWQAAGLPVASGPGVAVAPIENAALRPTGTWSTFRQTMAVMSGLVIKPTYMTLTFLLLLVLRRAKGRDMALLRRGLLAFLIGESFCAANYLAAGGAADMLDAAHGLGMVAMGVYLPWALLELLDERVLRLTDPERRCVLQRFCGACHKQEERGQEAGVGCGVHKLFLLLCPAAALVALIPWTAPLHGRHEVYEVFGTAVHYRYALELQLLDLRTLPVISAAAFMWAFVRLVRGPGAVRAAQRAFFLGVGAMGYSLLRFFLLEAFREVPVWSDLWEELTELLTILTVAMGLIVFRRQLGVLTWWPGRRARGSEESPG